MFAFQRYRVDHYQVAGHIPMNMFNKTKADPEHDIALLSTAEQTWEIHPGTLNTTSKRFATLLVAAAIGHKKENCGNLNKHYPV